MRITEAEEVKKEIGDDLWLLTRNLGWSIVEAERLTTLFSECLSRGSFRLKLSDGLTVKARCFQKEAEAANVNRLSRLLDREYFPRVLAAYGRGLLSEWIEGRPLNYQETGSDIFRKGGEIQGAIHSVPLPENLCERSYSGGGYWQYRLAKKIEYLVKNGFLAETEGERLSEIARGCSFQNLTVGLIHGDFCVENMILNERNRLSIVDIELISVTALAYDLARTVIRWPMNGRQRQAYLSGYLKFRRPDEFLANFYFWIILVLTEAAVFFAQGRLAQVKDGLNELRAVLRFSSQKELMQSYGFHTA